MTARGWMLGLTQAGTGAAVAAVLLAALQRPLRRRVPARWFCAVWLLLALRLVLILPLPGLVRLPLPQGLAFLAGPAELAGGETGAVPETAALPDAGGAEAAGGRERPENGAESLPLPGGASAEKDGADAAGSGQERSGGQDARERAAALLFAVWAVGCAGVLAWRLGGHFRFRRRLLRWAEPPEEQARQVLAREMEKLGLRRQVRLVTSGEGPLLLGPLCPVLALPLPGRMEREEGTGPDAEDTAARNSGSGPDGAESADDGLALTLRHELAHLARHDLAFKALLALACALHWANPFVWWMARQAAAEMELACDELALRGAGPAERRGYGEAIIAAASRRGGSGPALCTGFWGGKSGLRRRFEALVEGPVTPKRAAAPLFGLFAALLLVLGWLAGAVGADGPDAAAPGAPGGTVPGQDMAGPGDTDAQAEWQQTVVDFARNRNAYAVPVYDQDGETILAMRCEAPAGPGTWQREDPAVRMSLALPAGWTVRPAAEGEEVYAAGNGLNAPFNLFDAEGGWAGTMQYGSFTAEQIRDEGGFYGSGVHAAYYWLWGLPGGFGWDEQSCRPAAGDAFLDDPAAAGALLCETAGRAQAGHEGILAHDGALGRFVAIELRAGALSEAERLRLAESIILLAGDGPADTVPLLPGEPALPAGYVWQEAALGLPGSGLEELVAVRLALPEGCSLQPDTEQETVFGLASAGALILRDGETVGRLACGGFEPVADWPPENPRQVYAQLMLGAHAGWDFDYRELARNETVSVAVCLVGREASPRGPGDAPPPAGQEPENYRDGWWYQRGILCCDNALGVYAAIELEYGEFSDEVCRSIAESVRVMTG